jgi:flagellar biosynthetic protein FliQ
MDALMASLEGWPRTPSLPPSFETPRRRPSGYGGLLRMRAVLIQDDEGVFMTGPEVLDVARDAIVTLVLVAAPLMLVGLVVGVIISLFQALTQIQEQTIVYVPKILAIFAAMLIALPFMGDLLQAHMTRIAARIMGG